MKFHEQLTLLRKERNISQETLGEQLGVSRQAISKWETGATQPEMSNIERLCELFDVSPNVLMGYEEQISASSADEINFTSLQPQNTANRKTWIVFVVFVLLTLCVGIFIGWFLGKGQTETDNIVDDFKITSCHLEELSSFKDPSYPMEDRTLILSFTSNLTDENLSYTVLLDSSPNKLRTYEPVWTENGYEANVYVDFSRTTLISIQCSDGTNTKTLEAVEVVGNQKDGIKYNLLYR